MNATASGSSAAVTKPAHPSQRGRTPWRSAATDTATTNRIAPIAPLASSNPASSNSRRVFGSSWNSAPVAAKAVARDTALPARTKAADVIPPAQESAARGAVSPSDLAMSPRNPWAKRISASAAAAIRKNATTSLVRWPLSA
jgi:hypothetical protein